MNEITNDKIAIEEIESEIEDFEANEDIIYEVWAIGYDENNNITDCAFLLKEFTDPAEALIFTKAITLSDLLDEVAAIEYDMTEVTYFSVEVETVIPCEDEEDGTENIDTIWEKTIEI